MVGRTGYMPEAAKASALRAGMTDASRVATCHGRRGSAVPKWVTVTSDGIVTVRDDEPTLETMQQAVLGDLEALPSPVPGVSVFVAMEQAGLPVNGKATTFMVNNLWPGTRILGPLVLTGDPIGDGELAELTDEQVALLQEKLK